MSKHVHHSVFRLLWRIVVYSLLFVASVGVLFWYMARVPHTAPGIVEQSQYIEIPSGTSAGGAAAILEEQGIIRSADTLLLSLKISGQDGAIKSGTYYFDVPHTLSEVIDRITSADYGSPLVTITLFEGEANFRYAERFEREFEYISAKEFIRVATPYEGYLFPDTYTIPERATADEVVDIMRDNFDRRIESLREDIESSSYSLDEIITMASLVETEAGNASYETKQRVSGVLWRRFDIGMLLQADAVFSYIFGEHLPRVLYRHLEVDSPYNLYKHTGLPPGPIGNPGFDSIRATLEPVNPEGYLYYLTGHDGKFYYAKTLSGHEQNRRNHLQY